MKELIAFIFWCILTMVFAFSIIGMVLFIPAEYERSTWMEIGYDLKEKIIK